jgi:hypothetical protein
MLPHEVLTAVPESEIVMKLARSPSQKKEKATSTTAIKQNLTGDFMLRLSYKSDEYAQRQVLSESVPDDQFSGFQT